MDNFKRILSKVKDTCLKGLKLGMEKIQPITSKVVTTCSKGVQWYLGLPQKTQIISAVIAGTVAVGSGTGIAIATAHHHEYIPTVTVETCEEQGYTTYTCECGDSYISDYVSALGHTEVIDEAISATCTTDGKTEGKHCSVCNKTIVAQEVVSALGHVEVTDDAVAPTCTATGLTQGSHCSRCSETLVERTVVDALGHNFVNYVSNDDATCTANGTETAKCERCNETHTRKDDDSALGHVEVTDDAVAPTCTATGLTQGSHCSRCNETLVGQTVVDALGHKKYVTTYEETTTVYYTMTNSTSYPFDISGNQITSTNKTNNSSATYTITAILPTRLELQYKVSSEDNYDKLIINHITGGYSFTEVNASGTYVIGFTQIVIYMAAGDQVTITYSKDVSVSQGDDCAYIKLITSATETTFTERKDLVLITDTNLSGFLASCTDGVSCDICGSMLLEPKSHQEVYDEEVAPTCTESGLTSGKHCAVCSETLIPQETVPALGHTEVIDEAISATCTTNGLTEGKHCSVCSAIIVPQNTTYAFGHTSDEWTVTTEATCTKNGQETKYCEFCGVVMSTRVIYAGHSYTSTQSPATCISNGTTTITCSKCLDSHTEEWTPITFFTDSTYYYLDQGGSVTYYLEFIVSNIEGGVVNYEQDIKQANSYTVTIYNTSNQDIRTYENVYETYDSITIRYYSNVFDSTFRIIISDGYSTYVYVMDSDNSTPVLLEEPVEHHQWDSTTCGYNATCLICSAEKKMQHSGKDGYCEKCYYTMYMPSFSLPTFPVYISNGEIECVAIAVNPYTSNDYMVTFDLTLIGWKNSPNYLMGCRIEIYDSSGLNLTTRYVVNGSEVAAGNYLETISITTIKSSSYIIYIYPWN